MTIFQKIIDREIPADIVFEDDRVLAFRDIQPQAPTHILIIPKKPLVSVAQMDESDHEMVGYLMHRAGLIAKEQGLEDFRLVTNSGAGAGQSVFHLHVHILGGRPFHWPPG
ncbi:MAG: histidine triad nucleotide-binding protein [Acidobacteriota bacterium]|nr:histidine triad nucleotide-binding protein [Acidobacteriota bacterium]